MSDAPLLSIRGPFGSVNAPFGCGICGDDRRDSDAWAAKASHYRETALGNLLADVMREQMGTDVAFIQGGSIPGFPFLASTIAIFSGAQLFALGIIGEYLARMHFRMMERPTYAVREHVS